MQKDMKKQNPIVNAHNEWDPLEEIIVGVVEGALVPPWDIIMEAALHGEDLWDFHKINGGKPWPEEMLKAAKKDHDEFCHAR